MRHTPCVLLHKHCNTCNVLALLGGPSPEYMLSSLMFQFSHISSRCVCVLRLTVSFLCVSHLSSLCLSCLISFALSPPSRRLSLLFRRGSVAHHSKQRLALLRGLVPSTLGLWQTAAWELLETSFANAVVRVSVNEVSCVHAAPPTCKCVLHRLRAFYICSAVSEMTGRIMVWRFPINALMAFELGVQSWDLWARKPSEIHPSFYCC